MINRRALGNLVATGVLTATPAGAGAADLPDLRSASRQRIGADKAFLRTAGFRTPGDGGGALYKLVQNEPSHAGKFMSADGAWWELAEQVVTPQMFGATGDGTADDAPALAGAFAYGRDVRFVGQLRLGSDPGIISGQTLAGYGHAADSASNAASRIIKDFTGPLRVGDLGGLADCEVRGAGGSEDDNIQVVGSRATLIRVTSTDAGRDAFRIGATGADGLNANFWSMTNCIALNARRHGLFISHTTSAINERWPQGMPDCNVGVSMNFDARGCKGSGVVVGNAIDCTFLANGVQNSGGPGFVLEAHARGHKIYALYSEGNNGGGGERGDELLILRGAAENLIIGLRSAQGAGASLLDLSQPGENAVYAFDSGLSRYAHRDRLTVYSDRGEDAAASLEFVTGDGQGTVATLQGVIQGSTGGRAVFSTKRDGDSLRSAWAVDDRQTLISFFGRAELGWDYVIPSTGDEIQIPGDRRGVDLDPRTALDTLTIVLPDRPVDGQLIGVNTTRSVRTMVFNGGGAAVRNDRAQIEDGGGVTFKYRADQTAWFRQS